MPINRRFPATQRKLKKAREEGDVAKSKELSGAMVVSIGFLWIFFGASWAYELYPFFVKCFSYGGDLTPRDMLSLFETSLQLSYAVLWPFFLLVIVTGLFAESMQVGCIFNFQQLLPKASRLNVFEGLRRSFWGGGEENEGRVIPTVISECLRLTLLVTLFLILLAAIACFGLRDFNILGLSILDSSEISLFGITLVQYSIAIISAVMLGFGLLDFQLARQRQRKRLMMDVEELKKELRESEGEGEIKQRRKLLHMEVVSRNLIEGVRKARVLIFGTSENNARESI